jgi:hypothetical protein
MDGLVVRHSDYFTIRNWQKGNICWRRNLIMMFIHLTEPLFHLPTSFFIGIYLFLLCFINSSINSIFCDIVSNTTVKYRQ